MFQKVALLMLFSYSNFLFNEIVDAFLTQYFGTSRNQTFTIAFNCSCT